MAKKNQDNIASDAETTSTVFSVEEKQQLKHKLKAEVKKKFIIGAKYILTGMKKGFKKDDRVFLLKKFVYSVEDRRTNILIMKQIAGKNMTSGHLSRHDCLILHIKYEPGLQVWPMELKWHILKEKSDETEKK